MDGSDAGVLPLRSASGSTAGRPDGADVLRRLGLLQLAIAAVPGALLAASAFSPALPLVAEVRRGLAGLPLAASLVALAGLLGAWILARARGRAPAALVGRAARWPQAVAVPALALSSIAFAWLLRPAPTPVVASPNLCYALGGGALVLAFPLLVAERIVAAIPATRLPEAVALRHLLLVPALAWPLAGVLEIAAALGAPRPAGWIGGAGSLLVALIGAELALRALARSFLPAPAPEAARAAVFSTLARLLARGAATRGGLAAPIRDHLGLDFSRSWALTYARAALLPLLLLLVLLSWGMSGLVLVGPDERAVYERLGAPVAVLHPGLHAGLPWPLGRARRLEYGPVHAAALAAGESIAREPRADAEAPAPRSADRLWEQAHPGEVAFLIASRGSDGQQLFQSVSADLRVLWRVGLADADALRATYGLAAPEALVQASAGRVAAGFFGGRTLDQVLGENREAMAERMRAAVQDELDRAGAGIEIVAVVIEAIHPPAGAAEAYHGVQAAEIDVAAGIAAERGRALAARASALQYAADLVAKAKGVAAETTGEAAATLTRFTADRDAARAGGDAFLFERYFASIAAALPRVPLTIVDSRLAAPDAPILDLRPPGGSASAPGAGPGME